MALYRGWSLGEMREGSDDNACPRLSAPFPSSFTPINAPAHNAGQQPTPPLTEQTNATQRQRNSVVAGYLGRLDPETSSFDNYLPRPSAQVTDRKRKRDANQTTARRKASKKSAKQKPVSGGLRVTKPHAGQALTPKETQDYYLEKPNCVKAASRLKTSDNDVQEHQRCHTADSIKQPPSPTSHEQHDLESRPETPFYEGAADSIGTGIDDTLGKSIVPVSIEGSKLNESVETAPAVSKNSGTDSLAGFCLEILPVSPSIDGSDTSLDAPSDIDDIFDAVDIDHGCTRYGPSDVKSQSTGALNCEEPLTMPKNQDNALDFFNDGVDDDDFREIDTHCKDYGESTVFNPKEQSASTSLFEVPPYTPASKSSRPVHQHQTSYTADADDSGLIGQFISPMTPISLSQGPLVDIKPICRPPFPSQARDRSPVIGLTPNCLLRTCFRIGEAINAGCGAVKNSKNVILELYARVLSTERTETKQHFVFCDLFHTKPPYMHAEYDAAIWKSVSRHEYDARRFLQGHGYKMCRCIGKMKRSGNEWILTILNIWEAKMDDVLWVEGIVNA